jgi:hypothetical protein
LVVRLVKSLKFVGRRQKKKLLKKLQNQTLLKKWLQAVPLLLVLMAALSVERLVHESL